MTDDTPAPEPSNADLLAFMQQAFSHLTTELGKTNATVTDLKTDVAGLRSDLIATEARLTSRIGDVQAVVQNVKADLAAHDADGHGHTQAD